MTGAPGKAFRVKTAAKSGVGRSSAITVSVIFAGSGASRGVNSKRVEPDAEAGGQRGLAGEPGAVGGAGGEREGVLDTKEELVAIAARSEAEISPAAPFAT